MAGGDRLAPLIIFSVLFLALTIAIVPQMIDVFYANASNGGISNTSIGYQMIGGHQYQMWTTTSGGGTTNYSVNGSVSEWSAWTSAMLNGIVYPLGGINVALNTRTHFVFFDQASSPPTHHRLDIWVVRNNTGYASHLNDLQQDSQMAFDFLQKTNGMRDFFFFREYAYSGAIWDNTHNFYDIISFADISNPVRFIENTNTTIFNVMGKYNITFFAGPNSASNLNLTTALQRNQFSIQVGSDLMNMATRAHVGMWNIVGDLFLFHSEELGMPDWLNAFISVILWICVGFVVVALISRFIPTIPGL